MVLGLAGFLTAVVSRISVCGLGLKSCLRQEQKKLPHELGTKLDLGGLIKGYIANVVQGSYPSLNSETCLRSRFSWGPSTGVDLKVLSEKSFGF